MTNLWQGDEICDNPDAAHDPAVVHGVWEAEVGLGSQENVYTNQFTMCFSERVVDRDDSEVRENTARIEPIVDSDQPGCATGDMRTSRASLRTLGPHRPRCRIVRSGNGIVGSWDSVGRNASGDRLPASDERTRQGHSPECQTRWDLMGLPRFASRTGRFVGVWYSLSGSMPRRS